MGACCFGGLIAPARKSNKRYTEIVHERFLLSNAAGASPEDKYEVSSEALGEGGFGVVRSARVRKTGRNCVIKTMKKSGIEDQDRFVQEIELQAELDHPNILRIHEVFEDGEHVHLVLSPCQGGEVLEALDNVGCFNEGDAWVIMKQLLAAMCYMHGRHVAHRDLKLDNLLLKYKDVTVKENTMKLIDFGLAGHYEPFSDSLRTVCGTPFYMAPEVLTGQYNEKCDSWSCGVILYILLCGHPPFDGDTPHDIFTAAKNGRLNFDDEVWAGVKPTAKLLAAQLCVRDTKKRSSMTQALSSIWMKDCATDNESTVRGRRKSAAENLRRFKKKNVLERLTWTLIAHKIDDRHIRALQESFLALDVDGDGELSLKEIRRACSENRLTEKDLEDMFGSIHGKDEDAKISYSEYLASNLNSTEHLKQGSSWEAFQLIDTNGDGEISVEEIQAALKESNMQGTSKEEIEKMLADADLDGSASISFDEMKAMLAK